MFVVPVQSRTSSLRSDDLELYYLRDHQCKGPAISVGIHSPPSQRRVFFVTLGLHCSHLQLHLGVYAFRCLCQVARIALARVDEIDVQAVRLARAPVVWIS